MSMLREYEIIAVHKHVAGNAVVIERMKAYSFDVVQDRIRQLGEIYPQYSVF